MSDLPQPGRLPPPPGPSAPFGAPTPPRGPGRTPPSFPSPPPTQHPGASSSLPVAPPGYLAFGEGAGGTLPAPSGLRTATIVLFWVAAAMQLLVGLFAFRRSSVVDEYLDGTKAAADVDDASDALGGGIVLWFLASLAAVIVLAVWSHHTVNNAKRRDPGLGVSPGLAAGGWFIPLGNFVVPWQQIRNAATRFVTLSSAMNVWQAVYIASAVLWLIGRLSVGGTVDLRDDGAVGRLQLQGVFFLLSAVVLAAAAVFARTAMREVDHATSGQPA